MKESGAVLERVTTEKDEGMTMKALVYHGPGGAPGRKPKPRLDSPRTPSSG